MTRMRVKRWTLITLLPMASAGVGEITGLVCPSLVKSTINLPNLPNSLRHVRRLRIENDLHRFHERDQNDGQSSDKSGCNVSVAVSERVGLHLHLAAQQQGGSCLRLFAA